jgi:hypothetical protein
MIALALTVVAPTTAFATTAAQLGQTRENYFCSPSEQWIQTATSSGRSYVVPNGYTKLTKWRTRGGTDAGTMQFEVWAPAGGKKYTLVYISAETALEAGKITTVALEPAVKVVAGDVIGYRSVSPANCALETGNAADSYLYDASRSAPSVGATVGFQGPATGFEFNIAAVAR